MSGAPTFDTGKKEKKQKRGEFITPPRPTGRQSNKLSLNITKTEFMIIGSRQRVNASQDNIDIRIHDREVKRVHSTKSLGLHIQ